MTGTARRRLRSSTRSQKSKSERNVPPSSRARTIASMAPIPTFFTDKQVHGLILVIVAAFLLPLRLATLVVLYNQWALPTREFTDEEKGFLRQLRQPPTGENDDPA